MIFKMVPELNKIGGLFQNVEENKILATLTVGNMELGKVLGTKILRHKIIRLGWIGGRDGIAQTKY